MPEISETLKGSFTKFFGTVRQKIFDGNLWYPQLCIKFFDTPNFLKHWRDAHEIFRHYETKNFRRKNVIPPFSSVKLFGTKNFLKNSRIPLRKFSALWDIKISTENRDMPPLIHKFFSIPKMFWKTAGFLYKAFRFGPMRQKVLTKPWCPPPPLLCMKIFDKRIFLKHQKVLQWNISVQWDKNFDGKSWYPPLLSKRFRYPKLMKHSTEGFTYQIFRQWETKKIRQKIENRDITLWSIKFFDTRNFPIHRSVPQRNFSVLWDKKFWTKSRGTPSFA